MAEGEASLTVKILAIASHVTYGYVGNSMVVPILQSLGREVSALNTINLSNHKAYRQSRGKAVPAEDIKEIYDGLKDSFLDDFNALISGYIPTASSLEAVGAIARDLKLRSATKAGSFFWVLDPVMGDNGKLYVDEAIVPVYKSLIHEADLLLPNQFELETLSDQKVNDLESLKSALSKLHQEYRIPHIVVTSARFGDSVSHIYVVGSSKQQDGSPRFFKFEIPIVDGFFSGTGDMFAALVFSRFKDAAVEAGIHNTKSWISPDEVNPLDLPLAGATAMTLGSIQSILQKTQQDGQKEIESMESIMTQESGSEKRQWLRTTKANEIRLIRNLNLLDAPEQAFEAKELE